ncbi:conserved hypothetical protein [Streptomyces sviceus ATCC 29083]|uniref:Uncharacterized protein n=1 Tax=Streptomyces sviceus (strain ATCC 29083 / DSM 924 / JCM 4929 / NBRC 13980 / NCIMB 11184 / NRRL 5439 / UC 5370) TaxID=463191 RepID=B5I3N2_STRX2|nr:conserved hypothetical protein [Streptomyces sviceus ATCC 29083]
MPSGTRILDGFRRCQVEPGPGDEALDEPGVVPHALVQISVAVQTRLVSAAVTATTVVRPRRPQVALLGRVPKVDQDTCSGPGMCHAMLTS